MFHTWEIVNSNRPIWTREKDEIIDEEHNEFFNIISKKSCNDPASWTDFNSEGNINFKYILHLHIKLLKHFMNKEEDKNNEMKLHVKKALASD